MINDIKIKWKERLLDILKELPEDFTLSLSGGVDSSMILYGLLEINKLPKQIITFTLDGYNSTDLYFVKKICNEYNLPLDIVTIPILNKKNLSE